MKLKVEDIVRLTQPMASNGSRPASALQHLAEVAVSAELSLAVLLLSDHVQAAMEYYERIRIKLNDKYGTLNEKTNRYAFATDEDRRRFDDAFQRLLQHELELDCEPLDWQKVKQANLTAAQLSVLRPVVDGLPAAPGEDYNPLSDFEDELLGGDEE